MIDWNLFFCCEYNNDEVSSLGEIGDESLLVYNSLDIASPLSAEATPPISLLAILRVRSTVTSGDEGGELKVDDEFE